MEAPVRTLTLAIAVLAISLCAPAQQATQPPGDRAGFHTLTVVIEGINQLGGNIGVLVFNSPRGWPEGLDLALRDVVVPAQPGTLTVRVPDLPSGSYGVAVAHDVNKNRKLDKNFFGKPKEQWALSNNPHATIKAPPFSKSQFSLTSDKTIHVTMQ